MLRISSLLMIIFMSLGTLYAQATTQLLHFGASDFEIVTSFDANDNAKQTAFIAFQATNGIDTKLSYSGSWKSMVAIRNKEDLAVILSAKSNGKGLHVFAIKTSPTSFHCSNVGWIEWAIYGLEVAN